ncbi:hypothetical protein BDQ17DRAFT_1414604 [Cyathus striatus]|nr:hypothetical protein BDQ17DRAFT_1414604 [Cyathus striatus]
MYNILFMNGTVRYRFFCTVSARYMIFDVYGTCTVLSRIMCVSVVWYVRYARYIYGTNHYCTVHRVPFSTVRTVKNCRPEEKCTNGKTSIRRHCQHPWQTSYEEIQVMFFTSLSDTEMRSIPTITLISRELSYQMSALWYTILKTWSHQNSFMENRMGITSKGMEMWLWLYLYWHGNCQLGVNQRAGRRVHTRTGWTVDDLSYPLPGS